MGAPSIARATLGEPAASVAADAGSDGLNSTVVNFDIANAESLFLTGNAAFFDLGANLGSGTFFDWGLPFFFRPPGVRRHCRQEHLGRSRIDAAVGL